VTERIIISGFGGQGVMLMGKILAAAALKNKRHVTGIPSYGAEVRGGTAHCMIIISDKEIGSPFVSQPDSCIVMNEPSLDKFESKIKKGGVLFVNSSLVKRKPKRGDLKIFKVPFTDIASKIGNVKIANMVALGKYIREIKIIPDSFLLNVLRNLVGNKKILKLDEKALKEGMLYGKS